MLWEWILAGALIESGYYDDNAVLEKCIEVKRLLIASLNTAKSKLNK